MGATNRSDLFAARDSSQGDSKQNYERENKSVVSEKALEDDQPLQLEHMIGYAGDYRGTVLGSGMDESIYFRR